MGKFIDLTNQRFGKLVVMYRSENRNGRVMWHCKCDCGNEIDTRTDQLRGGKCKSCGCSSSTKGKIRISTTLNNKRFGRLTVIEDSGNRTSNSKILWKCKCDCGRFIEVRTDSLTSGNTKSCGCLKSRGELAIIKLLENNKIIYSTQKTFDGCVFPKTGYNAIFDFFVDNKYLIEYDGRQHFEISEGWNDAERHQDIVDRDNYKNEWCKNNGIPLIRIPYTILDKLTIDDLLLETTKYKVDN